jgi:hypothetical protein
MSKAAELAALIGSQSSLSNRNLILNGSMQVAQRSASFATSVSFGYHTVDRIKIQGSSSVGQWTSSQDSDAPAGFTKSFKLDCTTADTSLGTTDHFGFAYLPEGFHMDSVGKGTSGAKPMTLSFYLKATVIKTMVVELSDAGNSRHVNFAVTPSATNTWERVTLSIPADTSGSFNQGTNSKAAELNFWLGAGTNYTTGSTQATWVARTAANIMAGVSNWADSTSNAIWITGLQLEIGEQATPFEHRSYGNELAACQRYYYRSPQEANGEVFIVYFANGGITGTTNFPVTMRAIPTVAYGWSTPYTGNTFANLGSGAVSTWTLTQNQVTRSRICNIYDSGKSGLTLGDAYATHLDADSEL